MIEVGLIGKKLGMSREFYKTGQSIPVTIISSINRQREKRLRRNSSRFWAGKIVKINKTYERVFFKKKY